MKQRDKNVGYYCDALASVVVSYSYDQVYRPRANLSALSFV